MSWTQGHRNIGQGVIKKINLKVSLINHGVLVASVLDIVTQTLGSLIKKTNVNLINHAIIVAGALDTEPLKQ